jgi:hypothetical protein
MLRLLFLVTTLTFALSHTASARLGESLAQCIERYGPVVEKRPTRLTQSHPEACVFSKAGISIIIEFRDDIAWNIRYRTVDLIVAQVTELLKANMAEGGGWSAAYEVAGVQYRLATDRHSVAAYDPGKRGDIGILEISSSDFNTAWRALYAAQLDAVVLAPPHQAVTKDLKGF